MTALAYERRLQALVRGAALLGQLPLGPFGCQQAADLYQIIAGARAILGPEIVTACQNLLEENPMTHDDLKKCVPQDVIDAAKQVGMDAETLAKLVVTHTVEAARSWLSWLKSKLP